MATRKRRIRQRPSQNRTPPAAWTPLVHVRQPPPREPGPLEQKLRFVGERLLDIAAEDPDRIFRMGENLAQGVNKLYRLFQEDPGAARRVVRDAVISNAARAAKKKMREK